MGEYKSSASCSVVRLLPKLLASTRTNLTIVLGKRIHDTAFVRCITWDSVSLLCVARDFFFPGTCGEKVSVSVPGLRFENTFADSPLRSIKAALVHEFSMWKYRAAIRMPRNEPTSVPSKIGNIFSLQIGALTTVPILHSSYNSSLDSSYLVSLLPCS